MGRTGAARGALAARRGRRWIGGDPLPNERTKEGESHRGNDQREQQREQSHTEDRHRETIGSKESAAAGTRCEDGLGWTMSSSSTGEMGDHSTRFHAGRSALRLPFDPPVGELPMAQPFEHIPVLRQEVVALFAEVPPGLVVDATVGGGGHASALLDAYPSLRLLGIDRDAVALEAAERRLARFGDRVSLDRARFSSLSDLLTSAGGVSGVLFDLGVSSPQLDVPSRGFSFRQDGPLDMRMDQSAGVPAAELVNTMSEEALAELFRENGETRYARRIARAIVSQRPVSSTEQLAEIVAMSVPMAARRRGHPARRVFQSLRIAVNDELGELRAALPIAVSSLSVGGVCAVISYHSGEDRLTKEVFVDFVSGGCVCPPGLPCVCGAVPRHRLVFRGSKKASAEELDVNPRAEAARLRAICRSEED
jgi:16S rRNA (cytosine1402-N4)-methyltransferase